MKRDEILNMPAGREMDTIILRDILKYKPVYVQDGSLFGVVGELDCWYDEDGVFVSLGTSPSNDISTAWKVVEKMKEYELHIMSGCNFKQYPNMLYGAKFENKNWSFVALGNTAPLAICRAALLAMVTA